MPSPLPFSFSHGRVSVGLAASQLSSTSRSGTIGIQFKSSVKNTANIYIGSVSTVTAGTNVTTDGFELAPGESLLTPIDDMFNVWLIALAAAQDLFWMLV